MKPANAAGQRVSDPAAVEPADIAGASAADAEPSDAGAETEEAETQNHAEGDAVDDGDDDGGAQQQRRASTHPAVLAIAVSPSGCVAERASLLAFASSVAVSTHTVSLCCGLRCETPFVVAMQAHHGSRT